MEIQHRSSFKNTWGIWEEDLFTNLKASPGGMEIPGRLLQEQRAGQALFPPLTLQHKHRTTCGNQQGPDIKYQLAYTTITHELQQSTPFNQASLSLGAMCPFPQKPGANLANTASPDPCVLEQSWSQWWLWRQWQWALWKPKVHLVKIAPLPMWPQSWRWQQLSFFKQTCVHLIKTACLTLELHCPQQASPPC